MRREISSGRRAGLCLVQRGGGAWMWGVVVGLVLAGSGSVRGDVVRRGEENKRKPKEIVAVPEALPMAATFTAGESVEIELKAAVGTLSQVDFIIRQAPKHGLLSAVRPHPREGNKALLTYTHANRNAPLQDSFVYACRVDGGPFSAPEKVTLTGRTYDPVLKVREQPMFDRLFAGGRAQSTVVVENVGAAPYRGALKWEAPWTGPEYLAVGAGQKVEMVVGFNPRRSGHYRWQLPLQENAPESVLHFYGDSIPALTVSPGRLNLKWDVGTRERSAVLTLANARSDVMEVSLKRPGRLRGEDKVVVMPDTRVETRLFLPAADVEAFQGEIELETFGVLEKVAVEAEAQPPAIVLVEPEKPVLNFERVSQRSEAVLEFIVGNGGGQELLATMMVRPPFWVEDGLEVIQLQPGQQRRFKVKLDTKIPGRYNGGLEIEGASEKQVLALIGEVVENKNPAPLMPQDKAPTTGHGRQMAGSVGEKKAPMPAPAPAEARKPRQASQNALLAMLATSGLPKSRASQNLHLEPVTYLEARDRTDSRLTLAWNKPKIMPAAWRVESASQGFNLEEGLAVKVWSVCRNWEPVKSAPEGQVAVLMKDLAPASVYEFRVMGVDAEGKVSKPSPAVSVATLAPWRVPSWVWRGLLLAALATVLYLLYRIRRGDFQLKFGSS